MTTPEQHPVIKASNDIYQFTPALHFKPENLEDLKKIILQAKDKKAKVRAHGTLQSFSDVTGTPDYSVDCQNLKKILTINPSNLVPGYASDAYVSVESGIQLLDLSNQLWDRGKAIPSISGYNGLSLAGAVSTASHGSNIGIGNVASMVVAVVLVTETGKTLLIEPINGPYKTINEGYREQGIDEVIRDDRWFYSVLVSMGCMGLIHSMTLRVRDAFYAHEKRSVHRWKDIKAQLASDKFFLPQDQRDWNHPYHEIWVNPHVTVVNGVSDHTCLLTERSILTGTHNPTTPQRARPMLFDMLNWIQGTIPAFTRIYQNIWPQNTPNVMDGVMHNMIDDTYIDRGYKTLSGHDKMGGMALEISLPMHKDNRYLEAIEKIFELAETEAKLASRYMSILSMRFVKSSKAYMAMQYSDDGSPTCMIEIPTVVGVTGAIDLFYKIEKLVYAYGGRPHWGLHFVGWTNIGHMIPQCYPKYNEWLGVFKQLNQTGMFGSPFTDRVGITTP